MKNEVFKSIMEDIEDKLTRELEQNEALIDEATPEGDLLSEALEVEYNNKLQCYYKYLRDVSNGNFIPEETFDSSEFVRLVNQLGYGHIDDNGHFVGNTNY